MGWDTPFLENLRAYVISIHPPRMGWDAWNFTHLSRAYDFNPPTPYGVGHALLDEICRDNCISIHPPRMGWDGASVITGACI